MRILSDREAIRRDQIPFQTGDPSLNDTNEDEDNLQILGLRKGRQIFLPPASLINTLSTYLHEVGHIIGDDMSFQAGLDNSDNAQVLSIDDVKNVYKMIQLSEIEQIFLRENLINNDKIESPESYDLLKSIANKLLKSFTKESFDPEEVTVNFVSQESLEQLAFESDISTISQDSDGKRYAKNSKEGRNSEIPAYTTEIICLQILENTLHRYRLLDLNSEFIIGTTLSPSHQRAKNLLNRAFRGKGWRLPSMLDIRRK